MELELWLSMWLMLAPLKVIGGRHKLVKYLLSKHDGDSPPNGYINVSMDAYLSQVFEIDEKRQIFKVLAWMTYQWFDESLTWNDTISNENVIWLPEKKFPFDKQECELRFTSWNLPVTYMDLHPIAINPDLTKYVPNDQWLLKSATIERRLIPYGILTVENYPEIFFRFVLIRRPLFYVFTLVMPSLMITTIAVIGLFSPSSSDDVRGEKVTLGITTMLTMAVFLLMISDQMPKDSTTIPLLSIFIMLQLGLVSGGTVATVIILNAQRRSDRHHKTHGQCQQSNEEQDHTRLSRPRRGDRMMESLSTSTLDNLGLTLCFTILIISTMTFLVYGAATVDF